MISKYIYFDNALKQVPPTVIKALRLFMREFGWFKSQTLLDTIVVYSFVFVGCSDLHYTTYFFSFIFVGLKDEYEYFLRAICFMLKRRTAVFMLFFCCY